MSNQKIQVEAGRAKIVGLLDKLERLRGAGPSREDIAADNEKLFYATAAAALQRAAHHAISDTAADAFVVRPRDPSGAIDLAPLLSMLLGPHVLAEALNVHLDALPDGMARAKRRTQIAEIEEALLAAEVAEEQAVRQCEAEGLNVARRASARPEIVLGLAQAPPAAAAYVVKSTPHDHRPRRSAGGVPSPYLTKPHRGEE